VTINPNPAYLVFDADTMYQGDGPSSLLFYFGSFPDTIIRSSLRNTSEPENSAIVSNSTSGEAQVITLACRQKLHELDAIVTLCLPDLTIDKVSSPRTDEILYDLLAVQVRKDFLYIPFVPCQPTHLLSTLLLFISRDGES
jgi:hypothetical protein